MRDPDVDRMIILRSVFRSGMWGMDWIELAQDRNRWWALVNGVNEHSSSIKCGVFLD